MNTRDLLNALEAHQDRKLRFRLPDGAIVPGDFHITEIEALQRSGVNCGGQVQRTRQTAVQLLAGSAGAPMACGRAASIFRKVLDGASGPDFDPQAEVILEYDQAGGQLARFPVRDTSVAADGALEIRLARLTSVCAPAQNRSGAGACCG